MKNLLIIEYYLQRPLKCNNVIAEEMGVSYRLVKKLTDEHKATGCVIVKSKMNDDTRN